MPNVEYFPGMRIGLDSLIAALKVVSRIFGEFGPRIRAAFPDVPAIVALMTFLEGLDAVLNAASEAFDDVKSPGGENDAIDWDNLPGRVLS